MNTENIIPVCLSAIAFLCLLCMALFFYYRKKEKNLFRRLQAMLDEAIAGTFEDKRLDETPMSAVENSFWRYLCDNRQAYLDITKQKAQIQELISDIAHQSVTPIANIMLYAQLLEEDARAAGNGQISEAAADIRTITEQLDKLDFLIQSLVKLSRLETGIISVNPKEQSIGSVLSAVERQFLLKASEKNIRFTVMDSAETAVFDRKWTIEAVANIVDNAIKYTPRGGAVSVSVLPYTMFLRIDVTDNGMGISEAEQAQIFTRFYRSSKAGEKQGVGIGLYLAREIIKAQSGYMKAASEAGKGSTFSVFLLKNQLSQN